VKSPLAIAALSLVGLLATASAHAVVVNPRGTGQVLIYPYFNAQAGNTTLITLVNENNDAKAIRLRVASSHTGEAELLFNLYLGARDAWTGAIFALPGAGGASTYNLITRDRSCTYPELSRSTELPKLADGSPYAPLRTPLNAAAATTGEGYIEVIEMGTIKTNSPTYTFITAVDGVPASCVALIGNWTGSYWSIDPKHDLANPTGGLSGNEAIVNPAAGTMFSMTAVALEEFRVDPLDRPRGTSSSVVLHTSNNDAHPSLADALTDPAADKVRADLIADGRPLTATYPASTQGVDAVSAVLMASSISSDFDISATGGASTSFVLAYPTRRFYADAAKVGNTPLPPYTAVIPSSIAAAGRGLVDFNAFNREAQVATSLVPPNGCGFTCPSDTSVFETATAAEVISVKNAADPLLGSAVRGYVGIDTLFDSGVVDLVFTENTAALTRPSAEGFQFGGLPVIGTRLINFINGQLSGGVLANYSNATPMTSRLHCRKGDVDNCNPQ
jgi:hypothetical protein